MNMVLGASGRPIVELGGRRAWRQFTKGELVCSLQWMQVTPGEPSEACMMFFRAHRAAEPRAFGIAQGHMHLYFDTRPGRSGSPLPALIERCFRGAVEMGFEPQRWLIKRLVDLACDAANDFKDMPSEQPAELDVKKPIMGIEVTAKVGGKVFAEALH